MKKEQRSMYEQVSSLLMIQNAVETFEHSMRSATAYAFLISGYRDEKQAIDNYLKRKHKEIDRRRKASSYERDVLDAVEHFASLTDEYVSWVRKENGQPLWRDVLISYCVALETCLKSIAVALEFAELHPDKGLNSQIIIPSVELSRVRRSVGKGWDTFVAEEPKIKTFFQGHIAAKRSAEFFRPERILPTFDWEACSVAFQIRNAVVHNMGFLPEQLNFEDVLFPAGAQLELSHEFLNRVKKNFEDLVFPFTGSGVLDLL